MFTPWSVASNDERKHKIRVAKVGIFSYIHEAMGSLLDLAAFFLWMDFSRGYFFLILSHRNDLLSRNSEHRRNKE